MFALLLAGLFAATSAVQAQDNTPFEAAGGWRVFKSSDGCVAFYSAPGSASVSLFYPSSRDAVTMIIQDANVPVVSDVKETVVLRAGRSQWGPVEAKSYKGDTGLPGILLAVNRPRALAEFGKAADITIVKRFNPPRTVTLVATDKAADMLARCVG
jgi:hypothetical protein